MSDVTHGPFVFSKYENLEESVVGIGFSLITVESFSWDRIFVHYEFLGRNVTANRFVAFNFKRVH